jgi:hypothetical protein
VDHDMVVVVAVLADIEKVRQRLAQVQQVFQ